MKQPLAKLLCRIGWHKPIFMWGFTGSYLKSFKDQTPDSVICKRCKINMDDKYTFDIAKLAYPHVTIRKRKK